MLIVGYAWLLYPLLLRVVSGVREQASPNELPTPSVCVVISAHNEERHIRQRIENLFELDYPAEQICARVGCDGCTDGTVEILRELAEAEPRLHLEVAEQCGGKIAMLKRLVAQSEEAILVFSDANTDFDADALQHLLRHFRDPTVGGVCGKLVLHDASGQETDEGFYWRWETRLKERESHIDSCLGANGAIYALRRPLFWDEIPDNAIVDDFVLGMKVREKGFRMLFEPAAHAHEELPPLVSDEWGRRVRIGAGDFQAIHYCRACLSPLYGAFAWMFWSHKVLRWFTPHLMCLALLAAGTAAVLTGRSMATPGFAGLLSAAPGATGFLLASALGLVVAVMGRMLRRARGPVFAIFRLADYFLTMQAALLAGFVRYRRGGLRGHWVRTGR